MLTKMSQILYMVLHKSHFKNFSSNINTPVNLRNNLVNFVFVFGLVKRGPSSDLIREEKMD